MTLVMVLLQINAEYLRKGSLHAFEWTHHSLLDCPLQLMRAEGCAQDSLDLKLGE